LAVRKLRLQAQEHTRERDLAESEVQRLQQELDVARKEVTSVRDSIIIEKRSLEDRLSEERKAKERTRRQLEERLEAVQAKQSKFRVGSQVAAPLLECLADQHARSVSEVRVGY